MDTLPAPAVKPDMIEILHGKKALEQITSDLDMTEPVLAWCYLIDPEWFTQLLATPLQHAQVQIIVDHRQRKTISTLLAVQPNLHARSWSWNRTLHDKTLIIPNRALIWLGTHNWTKGSWTLSTNRAARIVSRTATNQLLKIWMADYAQSRPILPR